MENSELEKMNSNRDNSLEPNIQLETIVQKGETQKQLKTSKSSNYLTLLWGMLPLKSKLKTKFSVTVGTLIGARTEIDVTEEDLNRISFVSFLQDHVVKTKKVDGSPFQGGNNAASYLISELEFISCQSTILEAIPKIIFLDSSFSDSWVNLRKFQLEQNGLTQIPSEIFQLTSLQELGLGKNLIKEIPQEIENLQRLAVLDLHNNRVEKLGKGILKLPKLKYLSLADNLLTSIDSNIEDLSSLTILHLQRNKIVGIATELHRLEFLETLNLSFNKIKVISPACLETLRNLRTLHMENNQLSGLPGAIANLVSLEELHLSSNLLSELPEDFSKLVQLRKLFLHNNNLTTLGNLLSPLTSLTELSLAENKNLQTIPQLNQSSQLSQLDISRNKISDISDLYSLTSLVLLKLGNNHIMELLPQISSLMQLKILILQSNQLEGLPSEIGLLTNLKQLDVSFNCLKQIPASIGNLISLEKLHLNHNQLTSIPGSVCQSQLLHLHLDNNLLLKLPSEFLNLTSLVKISIGNVEIQDGSADVFFMEESPHQFVQFLNVTRTTPHPLLLYGLSIIFAQTKYHEKLIETKILSDILYIAKYNEGRIRLEALKIICSLSNIGTFRSRLVEEGALRILMQLISQSDSFPEIVLYSIESIGNLGFESSNRLQILSNCGTELFQKLACKNADKRIEKKARRVLNILGCNDLAQPLVSKKGVRILTLDGGGVRGLVSIAIMEAIEKHTGKKIVELFDLIGGTSTGGFLSISIGAKGKSLEYCRRMYMDLCTKVFSTNESENFNWSGTFARMATGFSVVKTGTFYHKEVLEHFLKRELGEGYLMDTSEEKEARKVFVTSTLQSVFPPQTFLFRNYHYPLLPEPVQSRFQGSANHRIFEALRATSAAPFYFDEFTDGNGSFLDGGILENNPTGAAIHESKKIWPNSNIHCVVSIGTGREDPLPNTHGTSTIKGLVAAIVEGATNTESIANLLSDVLSPNTYFRFQPVHPAMCCKLDETRKGKLNELQQAVNDYVQQNSFQFERLAKILLEDLQRDDE